MPKPAKTTGNKNMIGKKLIELRKQHGLSQRDLAIKMQTLGYDIDKSVITRIETGKRYVTDIELYAFCLFFKISCDELIGITEQQAEKTEAKFEQMLQERFSHNIAY